MHKIGAYKFTIDMFDCDDSDVQYINSILPVLNMLREQYNSTKSNQDLITLKRMLPESFLQKRTVTIDNIRRILSSFFSWLEDEDYILKSPVRRIHRVKTGTNIKETYSDEALELMRDNCSELRDLAIIDMLASTGMRVGEMVLLNRNDIDFNERECIVFGKRSEERRVGKECRSRWSPYH